MRVFSNRHSRESGNPFQASAMAAPWIPAFAGMTIEKKAENPDAGYRVR
jgi:hypothetical protein